MDYREKYTYWLESNAVDEKTKQELLALKDDDAEIKERFYSDLQFGTAGLRGVHRSLRLRLLACWRRTA